MKRWIAGALGAAGLMVTGMADAQELMVEKKIFELPSFTTQSGRTLKNVRVGWESYGTLNADKSNAVLICHFFSGNSHAAGKYDPKDAAPGYWDAIIGPGKAIDTNKYFVLSSDTLVNLNTGDPEDHDDRPGLARSRYRQALRARFPGRDGAAISSMCRRRWSKVSASGSWRWSPAPRWARCRPMNGRRAIPRWSPRRCR